jgi:hypothetical protein
MKRGNGQTKGIYRGFLNAIEKALADAEIRDILNIANAGKDNWQASAWRLERKFPQKWGRKKAEDGDQELLELNKELVRQQIEKYKAEIAKLTGISDKDESDDGFVAALNAEAEVVWGDEDDEGGDE